MQSVEVREGMSSTSIASRNQKDASNTKAKRYQFMSSCTCIASSFLLSTLDMQTKQDPDPRRSQKVHQSMGGVRTSGLSKPCSPLKK